MRRPIDTSPDADERQLEAFRSMTPRDRLRLADAMSAEVRALARAGVRHRHPEYSPQELDAAVAEILLGHELAGARPRRPVGAR
jgi:hypothetical protein